MKEVHIEWSGLYLPREVQNSDKGGIYQFYGFHHVYDRYRKNALLYIGETDNFKRRFSDHEYLDSEIVPSFFKPESIKICLGRIVPNEDEIDIKHIEGLLIFAHNPAWNSRDIRWHRKIYDKFTIYNKGERGSLLGEVNGEEVGKFG